MVYKQNVDGYSAVAVWMVTTRTDISLIPEPVQKIFF